MWRWWWPRGGGGSGEGSLSFPPQRLAHGPILALESVITLSPLPVLRRGDSPAPPCIPPSHPQRCHLDPDRAIHLLSVPTPGAPITMATGRTNCNPHPPEVQPAVPAPHPHPGQEVGRPRGLGWGPLHCTAVALTSSAPNSHPTPGFNPHQPYPFPRVKFWSLGSGRGGGTAARGSVFVMWNQLWL